MAHRCHLTHLECSVTGERHEAGRAHTLSRAGKPLLARYDLEALGRDVDPDALRRHPPGLWRYLPLLPVSDAAAIVSLGEVETPLVPLATLAARAGARTVLVKDESRLPTGSFKARGLALAVAMARQFGIRRDCGATCRCCPCPILRRSSRWAKWRRR